jgi:hypothetical protein
LAAPSSILGSDSRSSSEGSGAPGVTEVAAGTSVQIAITVVLNYSDPIRSVMRSDLRQQYAATDTTPSPAETDHTSELIEIERMLRKSWAANRATDPDALRAVAPAGGWNSFELTVVGPPPRL